MFPQAKAKGEAIMNVKETLKNTNSFIKSNGYHFDNGAVENLYLCLKSKPFVILTGNTGFGQA